MCAYITLGSYDFDGYIDVFEKIVHESTILKSLYLIGIGIIFYTLGISCMLYTFIGNPGVPDEIFLHY